MGLTHSKNAPLVKGIKAALDHDDDLYAFPGDALYQFKNVKPYNLDRIVKPAAITYPKTTEQVAAIVRCAVEAKVKVQARGGGHSYANYCKSLFSFLISWYSRFEIRLSRLKMIRFEI